MLVMWLLLCNAPLGVDKGILGGLWPVGKFFGRVCLSGRLDEQAL